MSAHSARSLFADLFTTLKGVVVVLLSSPPWDELRSEYDLSTLRVRKPGPARKSFGAVIKLEPDVAGAFPNADAVKEALRFLIRVTKENRNALRSRDRDA